MFTQILRCYSVPAQAEIRLTQNFPEGEPCVAAQEPPVGLIVMFLSVLSGILPKHGFKKVDKKKTSYNLSCFITVVE